MYYCIARKFDRELNLVVRVETATLKYTKIILYTTRNDVMPALVLLALSTSSGISGLFIKERCCLSLQVLEQSHEFKKQKLAAC